MEFWGNILAQCAVGTGLIWMIRHWGIKIEDALKDLGKKVLAQELKAVRHESEIGFVKDEVADLKKADREMMKKMARLHHLRGAES